MPSANGHYGDSSDWTSLPQALRKALSGLPQLLKTDPHWLSLINTKAIAEPVTLGVHSTGGDAILATVHPNGVTSVSTGPPSKADFVLEAPGQDWAQLFGPDPVSPYNSLRGMQTCVKGVRVGGSEERWAQYCHLATRIVDLLREGEHGKIQEEPQSETDEDYVIGKYIYINAPVWGRCKVFYETAGTGPQQIIFLHTAGSDGRQYHSVMNDTRMREKCTMIAFDLPAHGRSYPGANYLPGNYSNSEESYVGTIREVIKTLKLNKPIVCGASMAGQACVAIAIRAEEVGAGGTIPMQGCDHLPVKYREFYDKSPTINQTLFIPDWVSSLMAPKTPKINKTLIWHTYSGQAYGVFHGDLDFYFGGFDGRDRVSSIDVKKCPVYFLSGEFDWSTPPALSKATAEKIPGAKFQMIEDLGHFTATENPQKFVPYLIDAIDWIQKTRAA